MNDLTAITLGETARPANTLDFAGPPGSFPLARYDLPKIRSAIKRDEINRGPASIWRYWMLLPADDPTKAVTMGEGYTPLVKLGSLGHKQLWLKNEGQNPSGSFNLKTAVEPPIDSF